MFCIRVKKTRGIAVSWLPRLCCVVFIEVSANIGFGAAGFGAAGGRPWTAGGPRPQSEASGALTGRSLETADHALLPADAVGPRPGPDRAAGVDSAEARFGGPDKDTNE